MIIKCKRCEHSWEYKGKKDINSKYPVYTVCPKCHTTVKIK